MSNLWIGLCRRDPGLRSDIWDLGYRPVWVDQRFPNRSMQMVVPDLLIASESQAHSVLFEWKSGSNADEDQLERYDDLEDPTWANAASVSPAAGASHCICIGGKPDNAERLQIGMDAISPDFPLIARVDDGLELVRGAFHAAGLAALFTPVFNFDWDMAPTQYLPIDGESEVWEVGEQIVPRLLGAMRDRRPTILIDELCSATCPITWSMMGQTAKDQLRARVTQFLTEAARRELRDFIEFAAGRVRFRQNPYDAPPKQRSAALRRLSGSQRRLISRLAAAQVGVIQLELDL